MSDIESTARKHSAHPERLDRQPEQGGTAQYSVSASSCIDLGYFVDHYSSAIIANRGSYVAHVKYLHAKIAKHGTAAVCILDMVRSEDDLDQSDHVPPYRGDLSEDDSGSESSPAPGRLLKDDTGQPFYIGPSPMATFLSQADSNIGKAMNDFRDAQLHRNAEDSLADLSSTFASVGFQDANEVRKNVQSLKRSNEIFFIPEKEEGLYLTKLFADAMSAGGPFCQKPPEELLPRIVFEPSTVKERGWLLLFNAVVSTNLAVMKPPDLRLSRCLQWNTWMLVEDSSIFLEPSVVSAQALCLLAAHGQEITTPSLCWTIFTHACQMAQTLALHLPIPRTPLNSEVNQHRNCLFWGLFIIDKSLALSVGRPPLLPAYLYKNVPLPDSQALALFQPNGVPNERNMTQHESLVLLEFGSFHIMQNLEFAKLQGQVSDLMYSEEKSNTSKIVELKRNLDHWMDKLRNSPYYQIGSCTDPEEEEVRLGVNIQQFQYHHLVVYLMRGDKNNERTCLESARTAVSLLEHLVSNSGQVFNGIIWLLLYQPFTPYFALFSNIISHPTSPTCFKDLQCLRQVVLYFLQMNNNHPSAAKLEKVAETFTRLAEIYVRHTRQRSQNIPSQRSDLLGIIPENVTNSARYGYDSALQTSHVSTPLPGLETSHYAASNPSSDFSSIPSLPTLDANFNSEFNFNDLPSDPMTLLNFFTPSSNPSIPGVDTQEQGSQDLLMEDQSALFKELKNFEQNGTLDGTFDWFSWDLYDSNMS
ncbi:hypothetical protein EG329_013284 [Mollisiaceae sp. DMI_Dod_QoI]|nr:hypothetical protein EG329_013284 [Helotiales sp. DMI_Dod_QoI]